MVADSLVEEVIKRLHDRNKELQWPWKGQSEGGESSKDQLKKTCLGDNLRGVTEQKDCTVSGQVEHHCLLEQEWTRICSDLEQDSAVHLSECW